MKKLNLFFFLICAFFTQSILAQAPQGFSYQAVARDITDKIIKDEFISMRFWIIADNTNGAPVYRETHQGVYTGINGVITRIIGSGTADVGNFNNIDWGSKNYFIRVDMDVNGGTNFTQMGTSQLMSVPYAMFAMKAGSGGSGGADNWGTQKVVSNQTLIGDGTAANPLRVNASEVNTDNQTLTVNGNQLSISNGNTVAIPTGTTYTPGTGININNNVISNTGDNDNNPTNEIQQLSISGTTLSLSSNGGSVTLPSSGGGDNWGTQTSVSDGTTLTGNGTSSSPTKLDNQNATNGQVLKSNGTTWTPGTDNDNQNLSNTSSNNTVDLNISNGSGTSFSIDDGDSDDSNELQDLSNSTSNNNVTLNISNGSGTTFSIKDDDSNPNNEIQTLSISGNQLSISGSNQVNLPSNSLWSMNPQFLGINYMHEVSVGTDAVFGEFNVNGRGVFFNISNPTKRTTINSNGTITLGLGTGKTMDIGNPDFGRIELFNANKSTILLDRTSSGGGFLGITNQFGNNMVVQAFGRDDDGVGQIETYAASNLNTYIGRDASDPRHGHIAVFNTAAANKAGMGVNGAGQGFIYGDVKNFKMDYPGRAGKEIWYASLEGPEAGAYERGTGTLVNGEGFIPFSEHFELVIVEKGMTVMLTPLSGESLGLAVIEKTKQGFKVKELHNGQGNYSFDWEVKGVRAGFERYEVIRDKTDFMPAISEHK